MGFRSTSASKGGDDVHRGEWWGPADARRRRRRESSEQLVGLFDLLPEQDALLLRAVYVEGKSIRQMATLTRLPARRLGGRIRRLLRRIRTPMFSFVAAQSPRWPAPRRQVAQAVVMHGRSFRETGRQLGLSLHAVRCHHASVEAMCEAAHAIRQELAGVSHPRTDDRGGPA